MAGAGKGSGEGAGKRPLLENPGPNLPPPWGDPVSWEPLLNPEPLKPKPTPWLKSLKSSGFGLGADSVCAGEKLSPLKNLGPPAGFAPKKVELCSGPRLKPGPNLVPLWPNSPKLS